MENVAGYISDLNANYLKDVICFCDKWTDSVNTNLWVDLEIYDNSSIICSDICRWNPCHYEAVKIKTNSCTQDCICVDGDCTCDNGWYCLNTELTLKPLNSTKKRDGSSLVPLSTSGVSNIQSWISLECESEMQIRIEKYNEDPNVKGLNVLYFSWNANSAITKLDWIVEAENFKYIAKEDQNNWILLDDVSKDESGKFSVSLMKYGQGTYKLLDTPDNHLLKSEDSKEQFAAQTILISVSCILVALTALILFLITRRHYLKKNTLVRINLQN